MYIYIIIYNYYKRIISNKIITLMIMIIKHD